MDLKLKSITRPKKGDTDRDIAWVCDTLGLSSGRDTEATSTRIVIDILNKRSDEERVFSEGIAQDLNLTQGLVNHHLRHLIESGIFVREKKQIFIRGGSLKEAIRELRRDALFVFEHLEDMAEEIDEDLGIESR